MCISDWRSDVCSSDLMATDRASAVQAAAQLSQTVAALKSTFASRSFSGTDAFSMVDAISSKAISDRYTDYSGSQQAVMGVDTLLNSMVSSGDRKSVVQGQSVSVRVDLGGLRNIQQKTNLR